MAKHRTIQTTVSSTFFVASLFGATAMCPSSHGADNAASKLSPLRVSGNQLMAAGRAVSLRGLDWGWWHLMGTRYSEADMEDVARWGANVVRLSFSSTDLQTDSDSPVPKVAGYRDIDDVVQWAKANRIYVILDMHVVPGGQSDAPYVLAGQNQIWTNPAVQAQFVSLWQDIARRYNQQPTVAAYELLNEPGSRQKTPALLRSIDQRAIDGIRAVDPDKMIIVGGDRGSGPAELTDAMKFSDPNILYTFHWYLGAGGNEDWIKTERHPLNLASTCDWTKIEQTVTAPPNADHMSAVFRSTGNTGSVWFDDVTITDSSGQLIESQSFDDGPGTYKPQAQPQTMKFDFAIGHDRPGSLKVQNSTLPNDWAGWMNKRVAIHPGQRYRISAWVKLDYNTGTTEQEAMFVRLNTHIDQDLFEVKIVPAVAFGKKYNVPLWVGEFGCDTSSPELQPLWVTACIDLFEKNNVSWTYWNDRETSSPHGMGAARGTS